MQNASYCYYWRHTLEKKGVTIKDPANRFTLGLSSMAAILMFSVPQHSYGSDKWYSQKHSSHQWGGKKTSVISERPTRKTSQKLLWVPHKQHTLWNIEHVTRTHWVYVQSSWWLSQQSYFFCQNTGLISLGTHLWKVCLNQKYLKWIRAACSTLFETEALTKRCKRKARSTQYKSQLIHSWCKCRVLDQNHLVRVQAVIVDA